MARATSLNPFAAAPKSRGGSDPFLGVLPALIRQIETGQIDYRTQRDMIAQAAYYAKRNKLANFTPDMKGVIAMAAHADQLHRDHLAAMEARNRDDFRPEMTGFDRASGIEI